MSDPTPIRDPYAAVIVTASVEPNGHIVVNNGGKALLRMTRKQALHLMARLAVALAERANDE